MSKKLTDIPNIRIRLCKRVDFVLFQKLTETLSDIYYESVQVLNEGMPYSYAFFTPALIETENSPHCFMHKEAVLEFIQPYVDKYQASIDARREIQEHLLRFFNNCDDERAVVLIIPKTLHEEIWENMPDSTIPAIERELSDNDKALVAAALEGSIPKLIKRQLVFNTFG